MKKIISQVAMGFCFGLWLLVMQGFLWSGSAHAYSCDDPVRGPCLGINIWQEQPEYFGAYSDIRQGRLRCPAGTCDGAVANRVRLMDTVSPLCVTNRFGACWVEAGYVATPETGPNGPVFFWAEVRPTQQVPYAIHLAGPADPVGVVDHFMIIKDGRVFPETFLVFMYNSSLSTLYGGVSVAPTGVPMKANSIDIGQSLEGTTGASAPRVDFNRNIWAVRLLGPEYVFWYRPQVRRGLLREDRPPFVAWTIDPAAPRAPEGGRFTTHCCS